jgi:hypothetical protein
MALLIQRAYSMSSFNVFIQHPHFSQKTREMGHPDFIDPCVAKRYCYVQ